MAYQLITSLVGLLSSYIDMRHAKLIFFLGTSIGAFIGGLYAREGDLISSTARAKQFSGRMGNIWRILSDVTYPIVAYTTVSILTKVFLGHPSDTSVLGT